MAGANAMAWTYDSGTARGQAVWYHDGDSLKVCDMSADGRGIRGVIYSYNSAGDFWENEFSVTDSNAADGCKTGSKNVPDGRKNRGSRLPVLGRHDVLRRELDRRGLSRASSGPPGPCWAGRNADT
nr:hypothetical protein GCM10020092_101170 [Actinoplanes digitatis]